MKWNCCPTCFKKVCRCGEKYRLDIDYYMYPAIYELNRKGYKTTGCCSGHADGSGALPGVSFDQQLDVEINTEYWKFETYNYNGVHERRNQICLKPEIQKKLQKKRTNKEKLIQELNKDLYAWAKNLPNKIEPKVEPINFPDDYFVEEKETNEIVDIQYPWLLFTKNSTGNGIVLKDFFEEIEYKGQLTEVVVNKVGRIKQFVEKEYFPNQENYFKNKIEFDITSDYKHLLCGYEPYALIHKISVDNTTWYLAYARTDLATELGDEDYSHYSTDYYDDYEEYLAESSMYNTAKETSNFKIEGVIDEDDIEDFYDEYPDNNTIDLFAFLFNRMCRMNINICTFSSENITIIFSNKIDYKCLLTNQENVFAFGNYNYDYLDLSRIRVKHKEMFIYANGSLLMRKDVE